MEERDMERFYNRLIKSKAYKDFVVNAALTTREKGLITLICAHAEHDLGKLKEDIATQEGKLQTETLRTQTAIILGQSGLLVRKGLTFLVTPFSEMRSIDAEFRSEPQLALREREQDEAERTEASTMHTPESISAKASSREARMLEALPKWVQEPILFISERIGKLSPLTTVILFFLVISGSIAFAKYHYGAIANSYDLVVQENGRLKKFETQYGDVSRQLSEKDKTAQSLDRKLAIDNDRLSSQGKTIEELKSSTAQNRVAHSLELNALRANLDAATKETINRQDVRMLSLEAEKTRLSDEIKGLNLRLQEAAARNDIEPLREDNRFLRANLASKEGRIRELQHRETEVNSLTAFVTDLLASVRENLLGNDPKYTTRSRELFREDYSRIYAANPDFFERIGLQRF
jgi:hypothetical protein